MLRLSTQEVRNIVPISSFRHLVFACVISNLIVLASSRLLGFWYVLANGFCEAQAQRFKTHVVRSSDRGARGLLAKPARATRCDPWLSGHSSMLCGKVRFDGRFGRSRVLATMIDPRATVADTLATARSLATMKPTHKNSHGTMTETSTFCFFELMISFFCANDTRASAIDNTDSRDTHHHARSCWARSFRSAVRSPRSVL